MERERIYRTVRSRSFFIRKDGIGIEVGGEIRVTSAPGVYTLRITIKDGNTTVQQTREFELQK